MVLSSPCFTVKSWLVQDQTVPELAIPEQTDTGKGTSNPLMAGSLPKTTKPTYVNLFNGGLADKQARKCSGGIKWRLHVVVSLIVDPKASYMSSSQISLLQVHRVGVYEIFAPGHVLTEVARQHLDLKVVEYWGEKGVDYWNVVEWKKEKYENQVQEIVESGVAGVFILRQTYAWGLTSDLKGNKLWVTDLKIVAFYCLLGARQARCAS
ncbi:hypothetical protein Tco_0298824 [Tanacetum coccineum]